MRRTFSRRLFLLLFLLFLLAALVIASQRFRLFERAWFNLGRSAQAESISLSLADYRVQIEAQPIAGVDGDISALTYDPNRNSLYTLTNQNHKVLELSLDGKVLREIALTGFMDPEAIEYVAPGRFVIADERLHLLVEVRIGEQTTSLNAADGQRMSLELEMNGKNKGFEGLAYDPLGQRLFVGKERDPLRIYEVQGFPRSDSCVPGALSIRDDHERDARLFLRDLSSLYYHPGTGNLLVLSDESRLLVELDAGGHPLSSLSLFKGRQGLTATIPQAEGVTMDDQGALYLISEPNLFYRFGKSAE
jgi:uncharacterized protein YjiK